LDANQRLSEREAILARMCRLSSYPLPSILYSSILSPFLLKGGHTCPQTSSSSLNLIPRYCRPGNPSPFDQENLKDMDKPDATPKVISRDVLSKALGKRSYTLPWTFEKVPLPAGSRVVAGVRNVYSKMQKALGVYLFRDVKKPHDSISRIFELPHKATASWTSNSATMKIMPEITMVKSWVLPAAGVAGDRALDVIKGCNLDSLSDTELMKVWRFHGISKDGSDEVNSFPYST